MKRQVVPVDDCRDASASSAAGLAMSKGCKVDLDPRLLTRSGDRPRDRGSGSITVDKPTR